MQLLPCSLFRPFCFHLIKRNAFSPFFAFGQSFSPFFLLANHFHLSITLLFFFYLSRMTNLRFVLKKQNHPLVNILNCGKCFIIYLQTKPDRRSTLKTKPDPSPSRIRKLEDQHPTKEGIKKMNIMVTI